MRCFENTSDWFWKRDKPLGMFQVQGAVEQNMQSNYCETNDFHRISGALNYLKVLNENFETTSITHTITFITHIFPVLPEIHQQQSRGLYPLLGLVCFQFFSPWRGFETGGPDMGPL